MTELRVPICTYVMKLSSTKKRKQMLTPLIQAQQVAVLRHGRGASTNTYIARVASGRFTFLNLGKKAKFGSKANVT
ncbi:hypothetical protein Y032_0002g619 [Ancylostoma ceylanicum]|uniref:Uncharacterized protein n=1 Tax=Ancylostoma ceylanicum TaxID=53326 RepID=A0A016W0G3_9BILA|nr:hypothetical protein Y032_0002g619 [Ancylostoma ceylanicum]